MVSGRLNTLYFGLERAVIASAIHLLPLYELIIAYELFKLRIGDEIILFSVFFHAVAVHVKELVLTFGGS